MSSQPHYTLGVSGLAAHDSNGHHWEWLRDLSIPILELSMLEDRDELRRCLNTVAPLAFGIHWPLLAHQGTDLRMLEVSDTAFTNQMESLETLLTGTGASYLLLHVPQRGEHWPQDAVLSARLEALADLGSKLDMDIVLEPKETAGQPDGFSMFAEHVHQLPDRVIFCADVSDWQVANGNVGHRVQAAVAAGHVHLHAMHQRPDGRYRHAAPWVEVPPEGGWSIHNIVPHDIDWLCTGSAYVRVILEVTWQSHPVLAQALAQTQAHLDALGWQHQCSSGSRSS